MRWYYGLSHNHCRTEYVLVLIVTAATTNSWKIKKANYFRTELSFSRSSMEQADAESSQRFVHN